MYTHDQEALFGQTHAKVPDWCLNKSVARLLAVDTHSKTYTIGEVLEKFREVWRSL